MQRIFSHKFEITMEVGSGWVGPGLTRNFYLFWKSSKNSSKPVLIFWSSIPHVFCLYALLKVVSYYDLSVLSMSVMGFQKKKFGWVGWALSKFILDFCKAPKAHHSLLSLRSINQCIIARKVEWYKEISVLRPHCWRSRHVWWKWLIGWSGIN